MRIEGWYADDTDVKQRRFSQIQEINTDSFLKFMLKICENLRCQRHLRNLRSITPIFVL
jgi:hypothetical protein